MADNMIANNLSTNSHANNISRNSLATINRTNTSAASNQPTSVSITCITTSEPTSTHTSCATSITGTTNTGTSATPGPSGQALPAAQLQVVSPRNGPLFYPAVVILTGGSCICINFNGRSVVNNCFGSKITIKWS